MQHPLECRLWFKKNSQQEQKIGNITSHLTEKSQEIAVDKITYHSVKTARWKLIQTMFIVATATHLKRSKLESYICILGLQELPFFSFMLLSTLSVSENISSNHVA